MTNKITPVIGRISVNAAIPKTGSSSMSISTVPYAEDEMPSGERTPSASVLDRRCSPSCSLTRGGPSRRRLAVYQKACRRLLPASGGSASLGLATICAFPLRNVLVTATTPTQTGHGEAVEKSTHGGGCAWSGRSWPVSSSPAHGWLPAFLARSFDEGGTRIRLGSDSPSPAR